MSVPRPALKPEAASLNPKRMSVPRLALKPKAASLNPKRMSVPRPALKPKAASLNPKRMSVPRLAGLAAGRGTLYHARLGRELAARPLPLHNLEGPPPAVPSLVTRRPPSFLPLGSTVGFRARGKGLGRVRV